MRVHISQDISTLLSLCFEGGKIRSVYGGLATFSKSDRSQLLNFVQWALRGILYALLIASLLLLGCFRVNGVCIRKGQTLRACFGSHSHHPGLHFLLGLLGSFWQNEQQNEKG